MIDVSPNYDGLIHRAVGHRKPPENIAAGFFDPFNFDIRGNLDTRNFEAHCLLPVVELILQFLQRLAAPTKPLGSNLVCDAKYRHARATERSIDLQRHEFAASLSVRPSNNDKAASTVIARVSGFES